MRDRIQQIMAAWRVTRDIDPQLVPWVAGAAVLAFLVGLGLGLLLIGPISGVLFGLLFAILAAVVVFGRRAQSAQLAEIEGVPGAAAAVLQAMRGQWFVTPVVAFNRKQDLVHRVVGRPGVILVGEGSPSRVKQLLSQERRKLERVLGDEVPVHTVVVGDGDKAVELGRLNWHMTKLPRELKRTEVPKVDRKLRPLDKSNIPVPKGYVPNPGKKMR